MGQFRALRRNTERAQSLLECCSPIRCHPQVLARVVIRRTEASAFTWHSMPSVMGPWIAPWSSTCQQKGMIYREVPETPHKFLSLCFYSWGSLYLDHPSLPLLSRSKCHLLCEACLDLSVETHAFSSSSRSPVSTPTPLALMSIWLFYLVSGLPDMRAQSHAPSFQKHSAAWEGLHYPCSSRAHRLCQDLARRVLTKCLLMEELHHSSMCPLFPSLPLWGHECL